MLKPATVFGSLAASVLAMTFTHEARASALYFEKTTVKTGSEKTCLRFAEDVARSQRLKNVHKSVAEVAGEKDGAYIAITCIGRGSSQQAVAVVMSTSDSFEVAKRVGHEITAKINGIICFDTPC